MGTTACTLRIAGLVAFSACTYDTSQLIRPEPQTYDASSAIDGKTIVDLGNAGGTDGSLPRGDAPRIDTPLIGAIDGRVTAITDSSAMDSAGGLDGAREGRDAVMNGSGGSGGIGNDLGGVGGSRTSDSGSPPDVSGPDVPNVIIDTISSDPTAMAIGTARPSNVTKVNFYSVSTSATLQRVEFYLNITAPAALTWVVYEAPTTGAVFSLVSRSSTTATVGQGYQASDSLNTPLKSGYYYAIGVGWGDVAEGYWYNSTAVTYPVPVSFGALIGSYYAASTSIPDSIAFSSSSQFYPERLATIGAAGPAGR